MDGFSLPSIPVNQSPDYVRIHRSPRGLIRVTRSSTLLPREATVLYDFSPNSQVSSPQDVEVQNLRYSFAVACHAGNVILGDWLYPRFLLWQHSIDIPYERSQVTDEDWVLIKDKVNNCNLGTLPSPKVFKLFMSRIYSSLYSRATGELDVWGVPAPKYSDSVVIWNAGKPLNVRMAPRCRHLIHPGDPRKVIEVCPECNMIHCIQSLIRIAKAWNIVGGPGHRPRNRPEHDIRRYTRAIWHWEKCRWAAYRNLFEQLHKYESRWEKKMKNMGCLDDGCLSKVSDCKTALEISERAPLLDEHRHTRFVPAKRGINAPPSLVALLQPQTTPTTYTEPTPNASDLSRFLDSSSPVLSPSSSDHNSSQRPLPTNGLPKSKKVTWDPEIILPTSRPACYWARRSIFYLKDRYAAPRGSCWADTSFKNDVLYDALGGLWSTEQEPEPPPEEVGEFDAAGGFGFKATWKFSPPVIQDFDDDFEVMSESEIQTDSAGSRNVDCVDNSLQSTSWIQPRKDKGKRKAVQTTSPAFTTLLPIRPAINNGGAPIPFELGNTQIDPPQSAAQLALHPFTSGAPWTLQQNIFAASVNMVQSAASVEIIQPATLAREFQPTTPANMIQHASLANFFQPAVPFNIDPTVTLVNMFQSATPVQSNQAQMVPTIPGPANAAPASIPQTFTPMQATQPNMIPSISEPSNIFTDFDPTLMPSLPPPKSFLPAVGLLKAIAPRSLCRTAYDAFEDDGTMDGQRKDRSRRVRDKTPKENVFRRLIVPVIEMELEEE